MNLHHIVREQFPQYVRDEESDIIEFLEVYYEYLENNISSNLNLLMRDIDETDEHFYDFFISEMAEFASGFPDVDRQKIIKNAKALYKRKGTNPSFQMFFRLLYDTEATISFNADNILRASSVGSGDTIYKINLYVPDSEAFRESLENNRYVIDSISYGPTELALYKIYRYTERLEIYFSNQVSFDQNYFIVININDELFEFELLEVAQQFDVLHESLDVNGFRPSDTIEIRPTTDEYYSTNADFRISSVTNSRITGVTVFNSGIGYAVGDRIRLYEGITEEWFYVTAVNDDGAVTGLSGTTIGVVTPLTTTTYDYEGDFFFSDQPAQEIFTADGENLSFVVTGDWGRIVEYETIRNGSNLTAENSNFNQLSNFYFSERNIITGEPYIEFQTFNVGTNSWDSTGMGGKVVSKSPDGGAITIIERSDRTSTLPEGLNGWATLSAPDATLENRVLRVIIPQNGTGVVLNVLGYANNLRRMNPVADAFTYAYDSAFNLEIINDRQILNSSSSVIRDKAQNHEYAYIITTDISAVNWDTAFKNTMHPAGFGYFPQLNLSNDNDVFVSISDAIQLANQNLIDNSPDSRVWPNRTFENTVDLAQLPDYSNGQKVVAGARFIARDWNMDDTANDDAVQMSGAYKLRIRDELNGARLIYEEDYATAFQDIATETSGYERLRNSRADLSPPINVRELPERSREPNSSSYSEHYWYSGWARHSLDLEDKLNNRSVTTSYYTDYEGNWLPPEQTMFPKGNTPIRYFGYEYDTDRDVTLETITDDVNDRRFDSLNAFYNIAFPPDQRGVNENKIEYLEHGDSPDADPFTDTDPTQSELSCSLQPDTYVETIRGTMTFDTDYSNINMDIVGYGISNWQGNAWWDYEPRGYVSGYSSGELEITNIDDYTPQQRDRIYDVNTFMNLLTGDNAFSLVIRNINNLNNFRVSQSYTFTPDSSFTMTGTVVASTELDYDFGYLIINEEQIVEVSGTQTANVNFEFVAGTEYTVEFRYTSDSSVANNANAITYTLNRTNVLSATLSPITQYADNGETTDAWSYDAEGNWALYDGAVATKQIMGAPATYTALTDERVALLDFIKFDDDRKFDWRGIVYDNDYTEDQLPRARNLEVYRKKERDLLDALRNDFTYTSPYYTNMDGSPYVYQGIDAYDQIWGQNTFYMVIEGLYGYVYNLDPANGWQYSTNGGVTWRTGTTTIVDGFPVNRFRLNTGDYEQNQIVVRQVITAYTFRNIPLYAGHIYYEDAITIG